MSGRPTPARAPRTPSFARARAAACAVARGSRVVVALALLLAAGCAKKVNAPPPIAALPPDVVATAPVARSTSVPENTEIWAQFDRDLDPKTVTPQNVFLKIDTRRLSIAVAWDAATRRVRITPLVPLALFRTHTVDLEPGLAAADGTPLGAEYFWQFRTISVRQPRAPFPADRALDESPLASLQWAGTDPSAGAIAYDLFLGPDSSVVAARTAPAQHFISGTSVLPPARWPFSAPIFWAVRVYNFTTGESLDGPVWRFDVLAAATPIDSVGVPLREWFFGFTTSGFNNTYNRRCSTDSIVAGPAIDQNYLRWNLAGLSPGLKLAGASAEFSPYPGYANRVPSFMALSALGSFGNVCTTNTGPFVKPTPGGALALFERLPSGRMRFSSDAFAAVFERAVRANGPDGFMIASNLRLAFTSPLITFLPSSPPPSMTVYYYRTSAPAASH